MFKRKICLSQNVSLGLVLSLLISFSVPSALFAEERNAVDDISLGDLLNLEVSVATKTKTSVQESPAIVSVITADEIRNMGARNFVEVLRTVPGFDMTMSSVYSLLHKTNIRGMSSSAANDKIKVMINGHTLSFLAGETHLTLDRIPINNVRCIEIIRGPGSALYGTGAFIGVINVVTKKGGDEPSKVSAAAGSFNTFQPNAEFSYKNDDWKVYLYGEAFKTEGDEGYIDSDAFGASGNMTTDSKHHTFHTEVSYKDFYFSGYFQKIATEIPVSATNFLTDEDDSRYTVYFAELGYRIPVADRGNIGLRAYSDYGHQEAFVEIFSEEATAAIFGWDYGEGKYEQSIFTMPEFKYSVLGAEITGDYKLSDGIQIVAGISYEKSELYDAISWANANITGSPIEIDGVTYSSMEYLGGWRDISEKYNWIEEGERTVKAVYGQWITDFKKLFSLKKKVNALSLTLGVRYDDYDDVGSTTNPRVGLIYAPTEKLYFKTLYGTAFRAPSFREMYTKNNSVLLGNENLDPEKIATTEMLIGYNFSEAVKTSLTFFNMDAEDIIQEYTPPNEKRTVKNIGSMESRGIEADFRFFMDKHKYTYFNLTYQKVKNTTGDEIISTGGQIYKQDDFNPGNIPEFIANIGVNFDMTRYMNVNIWLNYVGERERSEEKEWDGENLVRTDNREPVEERYLVNASLIFRNFFKGMEFQLSGYNLLDDDHRDPEPSGSVENDIPEQGRSFMGKVSYSF